MASVQGAVESLSVAITGSGGAGVMTVGDLLLEAAVGVGWYGLQTRSVGPQIRGGESAALLRLSPRPVEIHGPAFDLVFAVDWLNFDRFAAEIPLTAKTVVVADPAAGEPPARVRECGAILVDLPIKDLVAAIAGGRPNMLALGVLAGHIGLPQDVMVALIADRFAAKGAAAVSSSTQAVTAGYAHSAALNAAPRLAAPAAPASSAGKRWVINGNEAAGLGAVRGGVRFAAAYPITPATEILEWLAPALAKVGGRLVQAEDELASINMTIGASFGGVPSLTATSGPGYALMTEAIGLATAAEVPIVVVDVMRGGPSTGIPTKSEQCDLNIAVYGLHGDAPHLVVAPNSVADCLFSTQWAVHLAEAMQVPAVVLSDQFLGQARVVIDRPAEVAFLARREHATHIEGDYRRYAVTGSGISPMAIPGTPGGQYTADGLEHNPRGTPSTRAEDHDAQLDKRQRKVADFTYGQHWADIEGDGELAVVTWGSSTGAVREAVRAARAKGLAVRTISLRLLAPALPAAMAAALEGARRVLVVEQTHSGQFLNYLKAHYDLAGEVRSCRHPGPLSISADEVLHAIEHWGQA